MRLKSSPWRLSIQLTCILSCLSLTTVTSAQTGNGNAAPAGMQQTQEVDRSADCNRACLRQHADRYLKALAANNPGSLEVTPTFQAAENSHPVVLGVNIWNTVQAIRPQRMYFTDPYAGQVLVLGVLEMHANQPFIYAIRLKVEGGRLSEAETMVTSERIAGQHFRPDLFADSVPLLDSTLPQDQRRSRSELLAIARVQLSYQAGTPPAVSGDCRHFENLDTDFSFNCRRVDGSGQSGPAFAESRNERTPLVDTEKGIVVGYALEDVARPQSRTPPEGEKTPVFYYTPLTFYVIRLAKFTGDEYHMDGTFMNLQELGAPVVFTK